MEKASGKTLIKVSAIILIVLGAFLLLTGALSMVGSSMMDSVANDPQVQAALAQTGGAVGTEDIAKIAMITGAITLGLGAAYLVVGIFGVIFSKRTDKAKLLMILSAVLMVLLLANTITSIVNGANFSGLILYLAEIIVAGLFFLGAKFNNDDAKAQKAAIAQAPEASIETESDKTEE